MSYLITDNEFNSRMRWTLDKDATGTEIIIDIEVKGKEN